MIKQIKFVTIPVRDQDRALAFWTEKMGLQIATDQPMNDQGLRWLELKIPGAQTGVALFPPKSEAEIGNFTGLSFHCDDVERTHKELAAAGVEFVQAPKKEDWGTSAIFKDPDGNSFVLSGR